jgi:hypothetical protein
MPFDFPNSPVVGQMVTGSNGSSYRWDGTKWATAPTSPFASNAGNIVTLAVDTTQDAYVNINATLAVATDTITLVHAYLVVFHA